MERCFLVLGDATWEVSGRQDLSALRESVRLVAENRGGFLDFLDSGGILRTVTVPFPLIEPLELVIRTSDEDPAPSWFRGDASPG